MTTTSAITSAASAATSTSSTTSSSTNSNETEFLNILMTELENQSPLDPVDPTTFTSQLVQYSSLEQQIDTNSKLDSLVTAVNKSTQLSAFSYIGSQVDVNSDTSVMQSGEAQWSYTLGSTAATVTATVTDSSGNVVSTQTLSGNNAGTYQFSIDSATAGVSEGTELNLAVTATDSSGNAVTTTVASSVKVEGISTDGNGNITLTAGDYSFSSDDVTGMTSGSKTSSSSSTST